MDSKRDDASGVEAVAGGGGSFSPSLLSFELVSERMAEMSSFGSATVEGAREVPDSSNINTHTVTHAHMKQAWGKETQRTFVASCGNGSRGMRAFHRVVMQGMIHPRPTNKAYSHLQQDDKRK